MKQKALITGIVSAVALNRLFEMSGCSVFIYLGMPGMLAHLMITGPHGGTTTEDQLGTFAEIVVNALIYAAVTFVLLTLVANKNRGIERAGESSV